VKVNNPKVIRGKGRPRKVNNNKHPIENQSKIKNKAKRKASTSRERSELKKAKKKK